MYIYICMYIYYCFIYIYIYYCSLYSYTIVIDIYIYTYTIVIYIYIYIFVCNPFFWSQEHHSSLDPHRGFKPDHWVKGSKFKARQNTDVKISSVDHPVFGANVDLCYSRTTKNFGFLCTR